MNDEQSANGVSERELSAYVISENICLASATFSDMTQRKGRALGNVSVERLWRSLKYEDIGLY